jgi:hypothetical protein
MQKNPKGPEGFPAKDETGRLPATCSAAPLRPSYFVQLSGHVNAVVKVDSVIL